MDWVAPKLGEKGCGGDPCMRIPGCFSKETQSIPSLRRSDRVKEKDAGNNPDKQGATASETASSVSDIAALIEERKVKSENVSFHILTSRASMVESPSAFFLSHFYESVISKTIGAGLDASKFAVQVSEWETL
jgi:hypothetical protein